MSKKKGFALIELIVVLGILSFIVGVVVLVVFLVSSGGSLMSDGDAALNRTDYVLQAKSMADHLGDPSRQGYGDGDWDDHDQKALFGAMNIPLNTSWEDIPSRRLKDFVESQGSD